LRRSRAVLNKKQQKAVFFRPRLEIIFNKSEGGLMINKRLLMAVVLCLLVGISGLFMTGRAEATISENMLTPEVHQVLTAGSTVDISWRGSLVEELYIEFSSDGGYHWSAVAIIEDTPDGAVGHYSWKVPDVESDLCIIRLKYKYVDFIGWHDGAMEGGMFSIRADAVVPHIIFEATAFIAAPANLVADPVDGGALALSWDDKSTNEDGFKLERKTAGHSYELLVSLPAGTETYDDSSAVPGTEYVYRLKAFKGSSSSAYSNETSAGIPAEEVPAEPEEPTEPEEPVEPGQPSSGGSGAVVMKFYIGSTEYYVNGKLKTMDAAPVIFEGRTILPIRYVADALGARVAWESQERKVTVSGTKTIELSIDDPWARVDGELAFIDPNNEKVTPLILPPGRTMLPLRFTAETLGCSVEWKPDVQEVTLRYPKS
jgi:hypothetical protein